MSEARYRSLAAEEVPAAAGVFIETVFDLARRNGLAAPSAYTQATVEPVYRHLRERGIFEVAELDGQIVAICSAIVRGEVWFLAMFWVLPGFQLRGIGRPLLERVRARGDALGARIFCTWSSIDYSAVATYIKQGMLPRGPIFKLAGTASRLPELAREVEVVPIDAGEAAQLERDLRGVSRPEDHAFWDARGMQSFAVRERARTLGYFYVDAAAIGPCAFADEQAAQSVLGAALHEASARGDLVQLVALGLNPHALRAGLDAGLRIVAASHFLCSQPFGALERYLPSGPALF